jgi:hypothetical protein
MPGNIWLIARIDGRATGLKRALKQALEAARAANFLQEG